jgi:NAD(P)-dependent dehydrogenase (short-subunit alcohol dehydrogenase family)
MREKLGRVDVVFNNAGVSLPATSFGDVDIVAWQNAINTNLNGAFYVAREAFRAMRDQSPQGGRIINNGSISASVPRPGAAAYTASKHAITGLTKAISLDGRAFDIACGQIDIGNTATDMTARMNSGSLQANGTIMPEPTFNVQHVVDAVIYMASLPLEANVQFITVMATKMPYIGRG